MNDLCLASFLRSEKDVFSSILALKSLKASGFQGPAVSMFITATTKINFEEKYPDLLIAEIIEKLNGKLLVGFQKGYNFNLGMRPLYGQFARRFKDDAYLYFSPRTIFYDFNWQNFTKNPISAAYCADDFWPNKQLYGPSLEEMWQSIISVGDAKSEDWINQDQPLEYWRRYPAASRELFYVENANAFHDTYSQISKEICDDIPQPLRGQSETFPEASLVATLIKMNGHIVDPNWDQDIIRYQDFYDLMLRLGSQRFDWFQNEILDDNIVRNIFKTVEEYKIILYQKRLTKIRGKLDDVEQNFSILRMQTLIGRRKIRRGVHMRLKALEKEKSQSN